MYKNIAESIQRSDTLVNKRISETNYLLEQSVLDVKSMIGRTDSDLSKLHNFVDKTEMLTEKRLTDRENEITDLKEYVNEEKKLSSNERKTIVDTIGENTKMMLTQFDEIDDKIQLRAKKTDVNFLEHKFSVKIADQEKEVSEKFDKNQNQIISYGQKLESTESELGSVKDELHVMKQALIYSAVAIAILAIVIPGIVFLVIRSKSKKANLRQSNGQVNDAYL